MQRIDSFKNNSRPQEPQRYGKNRCSKGLINNSLICCPFNKELNTIVLKMKLINHQILELKEVSLLADLSYEYG
jgi:hypothetical protein